MPTRIGCILPVAALALVAVLGPPPATAADTLRGARLYETKCGGCHDRSVHGRSPRVARSFSELREFVVRWNEQVGGSWSREEIDDVANYLNERYYLFPCPPAGCGSERAGTPARPAS
jgi:mono/diheme cytochrome c family protein